MPTCVDSIFSLISGNTACTNVCLSVDCAGFFDSVSTPKHHNTSANIDKLFSVLGNRSLVISECKLAGKFS